AVGPPVARRRPVAGPWPRRCRGEEPVKGRAPIHPGGFGKVGLRLRPAGAVALAGLVLAAVVVVSAALGPAGIGPVTLARMLATRVGLGPPEVSWPQSYEAIFFQVRLPRVVLGTLIGAALGVAGTT